MQFRWVVGITLWTFFSGPAAGPPPASLPPARARAATVERDPSPANVAVGGHGREVSRR